MDHPVFKNLRSLFTYTGTWMIITIVQFLFLYFLYGIPFLISFCDSLIFNSLYALAGLSVWFVVRYSAPRKGATFNLFFNHIASATLLVAVWLLLSEFILSALFSRNTFYIETLHQSVPWRIIAGVLFYTLLGLAYYLVVLYTDLQERARQEARLSELLKESELNMLKSQINPHFLFNSLNSVSSLTITNPMKAQEMVVRLSDFLRYSVSANSSRFVKLSQELENIERYLEIEKVRFGDKLQYSNQIEPSCLTAMIPAMLLQPLFENAIKHGVYESTGVVKIETECREEEKSMVILMRNNFETDSPGKKGAGVGLRNIRERLKLLYKQSDLLNASVEGNIFIVKLRIPL
jgi:two-component system, LytTR family, sensor kinase